MILWVCVCKLISSCIVARQRVPPVHMVYIYIAPGKEEGWWTPTWTRYASVRTRGLPRLPLAPVSYPEIYVRVYMRLVIADLISQVLSARQGWAIDRFKTGLASGQSICYSVALFFSSIWKFPREKYFFISRRLNNNLRLRSSRKVKILKSWDEFLENSVWFGSIIYFFLDQLFFFNKKLLKLKI